MGLVAVSVGFVAVVGITGGLIGVFGIRNEHETKDQPSKKKQERPAQPSAPGLPPGRSISSELQFLLPANYSLQGRALEKCSANRKQLH